MASLLSFPRIIRETIVTVRARLDRDANAGVDPLDTNFKDLTPGGFYFDVTQVVALEIERIWDLLGLEVPAAMFPAYAWGNYLDEHGDTIGIVRKEAVAATGTILFTGDPGSLIPTGVQVATQRTDPDADSITFRTTESVVLAATPAPTNLVVVATTGGTLTVNTYYYEVTAVTEDGETIASAESAVYVDPGAATPTNAVQMGWDPVDGATGYKVYRGLVAGELLFLADAATETYLDIGSPTASAETPPSNIVNVEAVLPGADGNVAAGTITLLLSPVGGITGILNAAATSGGAEVETDEQFRSRIIAEYRAPRGGGTIADYERWALAYLPIGFVKVEPVWSGPGTVRVIVTDQANNPVANVVTDGLQQQLDPNPGLGHGLAPVGAIVTVATPVLFDVDVDADVVLLPGFSLDTLGTITLRTEIEIAIRDYIDNLAPGDDVVREKVAAAILSVEGVYDVTVNAPAANVAIGALEVARTDTVTLAE